MQPQTAVVIGSTGMVGSCVVKNLLADPSFTTVRLLVRRPVEMVHERLEIVVVDFDNQSDFTNKLGKGDSLFCCVGTTQKKVKGDKAAYRKVDHDLPLLAAKLSIEAGFSQYLIVSSAGADANSKSFYLQLKGEVEKNIEAQKIQCFHIFRPGFLLGDRKEFRPGEWIGKNLMKVFSFLMIGSWSKYKAIHAETVARSMIAAAKSSKIGTNIYHNSDMKLMA